MKKITLIFFLLLLVLGYTMAEGGPMTDKQHVIQKYTLISGIIIGTAVDIGYIFGPYTGFQYLPDSPVVPGIILSSSFLQILSAATFSWLFSESFIRLKISPQLSFPVGLGEGALLGGISGGLTFALIFAIAVPTGAIALNQDYSHIDTWYEGALMGFTGGFMFGLIPGAVIGAIGGPGIVFALKSAQR